MVTGIILASGFSTRMGQDKLVMKVNGRKIVEWVIKNCKKSLLDEIILIYRKMEVKKCGERHGIKTLYNSKAHLGQSAGVKLGVTASHHSHAYMFIMGDQPLITSQLINKLICEYRKEKTSIIVPCYDGKNGTPTIFPSIYKDELLKIGGDQGGRSIIKRKNSKVRKVCINDGSMGFDIDTPEDYKLLRGKKYV